MLLHISIHIPIFIFIFVSIPISIFVFFIFIFYIFFIFIFIFLFIFVFIFIFILFFSFILIIIVKGGLTAPAQLSRELSAFMGIDLCGRTDVTKRVWAYIKSHELQNPADRREIICDTTLEKLFRKKKINMFKMAKYLADVSTNFCVVRSLIMCLLVCSVTVNYLRYDLFLFLLFQ